MTLQLVPNNVKLSYRTQPLANPFAFTLDRGRLDDEGMPDATPASVENAFGVLRINGFGYSSRCGGEGRALYPEIALCSHSCQPNVQQVSKPMHTPHMQ